jgi:NAD(P)-dependent dehydrogenase (short-subunit alcohol dehydrogenase family)
MAAHSLLLFLLLAATNATLTPISGVKNANQPSRSKNVKHYISWIRSIANDIKYNVLNTDRLSKDFSDKFMDKEELLSKMRYGAVTGSLGGIGKSISSLLKKLDFDVTIMSRYGKQLELQQFIQQQGGKGMQYLTVDLAIGKTNNGLKTLFSEILETARCVTRQSKGSLDILIHNAGLMGGSQRDIYAVNFYSPMVLTLLLLPQLLSSQCYDPVLVFVSSSSHLRGTIHHSSKVEGEGESHQPLLSMSNSESNSMRHYAGSKLRLILAATAMQRRLEGTGLIIRSVHPGIVDTPMLQGMLGSLQFPGRAKILRNGLEGASAVLLAAFDREKKQSIQITESAASERDASDSRKSYFVNGKSCLEVCSNYVNNKDSCENCYLSFLKEMTPELRMEIASRARSASNNLRKGLLEPLISNQNSNPFEESELCISDLQSRKLMDCRKVALLTLAKELENVQ